MFNRLGRSTLSYFAQPLRIIRSYRRADLRPDLTAGLTVAIVLLPQAIAFSLIAELPPQMGLYAAIMAAIVGALWGSSHHLHTGPTNAAALLVLTTLLPVATPGSPEFLAAAGVLAVMVGVFRMVMGLARLGLLVNFVSDSVIIGFTAGAGMLIAVNQLPHLLKLSLPSNPSLLATLREISLHLGDAHLLSLLLGLGVMALLLLLRFVRPRWPGALLGLSGVTLLVWLLHLEQDGVRILGTLPRSLPPLAELPFFDLDLLLALSPGALAVGAMGLVEASAIARSLAGQSGQRIDSNQEFVGQGLATIASGLFSGFATSGSFNRSGINVESGARTQLASVFSGLFVAVLMLVFAPLAGYIPRTGLAGVLLISAYYMIDRKEVVRILKGARGDAIIMLATFLATLLLPLQYAVLIGILLSFAVYVLRTSVPQVIPVVPGENFKHFVYQADRPACPQLGIFDILGDLYFGAVSHVEEILRAHFEQHPEQRFLLLRLFSVTQIDISGVHALENILRAYREQGGDIFVMRTQEPVMHLMETTGFHQILGQDHFLPYDKAISHLYHRVLDPAICIYECDVRVFQECQNLPRPAEQVLGTHLETQIPRDGIVTLTPEALWRELHQSQKPLVIDVREPREFHMGHVPGSELIPMLELLGDIGQVPREQPVVFTCRGGRRSARVVYFLKRQGFNNVRALKGGLLAWEAAGLLTAVEV